MQIARFGETWASSLSFFTANANDDWLVSAPPVLGQIGGASGAVDFFEDDPNPVQPTMVSKSFVIHSTTWAALEVYLDAYRQFPSYGRTKLWGECRDGSHRWAWAKCVEANVSDRAGNFLRFPVTMKFSLSEGVWYGESPLTYPMTVGNHTISNGTAVAYPVFTLTVNSGSLSSITLSDLASRWTWTYAHAITATKTLVVNASSLLCTHTGVVNAYQYLTIPVGQASWMWVATGGMGVSFSVVGSATISASLSYYRAYL